jgi:hypothetical protein
MRVVMQQQRQQILVEGGLRGARQRQAAFFAAPQVRQCAPPELLQLVGERTQRKAQRLLERAPNPSRALRLELVGVEPDRSLDKRAIEPELGLEPCRERHGLALAPFRRTALLRGCGGADLAAHHEKQLGKILRIDLHRRGIRQADQRLGCRMVDLEECVDFADRAHHLDGVWAIDLGHGVDGFIEIPGAHGCRLQFPTAGIAIGIS